MIRRSDLARIRSDPEGAFEITGLHDPLPFWARGLFNYQRRDEYVTEPNTVRQQAAYRLFRKEKQREILADQCLYGTGGLHRLIRRRYYDRPRIQTNGNSRSRRLHADRHRRL